MLNTIHKLRLEYKQRYGMPPSYLIVSLPAYRELKQKLIDEAHPDAFMHLPNTSHSIAILGALQQSVKCMGSKAIYRGQYQGMLVLTDTAHDAPTITLSNYAHNYPGAHWSHLVRTITSKEIKHGAPSGSIS